MEEDLEPLQFFPAQFGGNVNMQAPSSSSGAILFFATSITRQSSVQFAPDAKPTQMMTVQLLAMAEPKVRIVTYLISPGDITAVDDKGTALAPDPSQTGEMSYGASGNTLNFMLPLKYTDSHGGKIARLHGQLKLTVQTKIETASIENVLKAQGTERKAAECKLVLKSIKRENGQFMLSILLSRDDGDRNRLMKASQSSSFRLLDAEGREYQFANAVPDGEGAGGQALRLQFFVNQPVMGDPSKLIWEVARETRDLAIPFEFTDLPLP